jgi:serine protease Do
MMIFRILFIGFLSTICLYIPPVFSATPLEALQKNVNQATAAVMPSIVSVKAQKQSQNGILYESIGSGFVVDEKGYVLTNLHVVENSQNITVSQWRVGQNTISATVVNTDESLDLALLKIEGNNIFKPAPLDNSDQVQVGNLVICVGSPFGFKHSVTFGIVSDLHREIVIQGLTYKDMIQTDAVINEGNSGGPIINIFGRVIGVGTAIYAPDGTYTGIGFGIPINRAKHFFSQTTGAVLAAATAPLPVADPKEPIDITTKIPNDQTHKQFSDCRTCHVISAKSVVTVQAVMPHPPLEGCSDCHVLTNDKLPTAPVTVALNIPKQVPSFLQFGFFVRSAILILFGLVVGTVGTMVGVGGGFIHVPFLMLVCGFSVQDAIGTSIGIIFFNTTAGSFMYYQQKCIDIDLAKKLSMIVIPGAILGPLIVQQYSSSWFLVAFTLLLFTISCYLFFTNSQINVLPEYRYNRSVTIEDIDGNKISYSTNI